MRLPLIGAALGLLLVSTGPVAADEPANLVLVELFTSQGCSSCPPADDMLAELARSPGVVALAFHVDYWDYLGWKDGFADPAWSDRQRGYARYAGSKAIYTPQFVIQGADHVVGARPMEVMDLILRRGAVSAPVRLTLTRQAGAYLIRAEATGAFPEPVMVQLVHYRSSERVDISHGENAGRRITYVNIVTRIQDLGSWNGAAPLSLRAETAGGDASVVILQADGGGPVLAVARAD